MTTFILTLKDATIGELERIQGAVLTTDEVATLKIAYVGRLTVMAGTTSRTARAIEEDLDNDGFEDVTVTI